MRRRRKKIEVTLPKKTEVEVGEVIHKGSSNSKGLKTLEKSGEFGVSYA